MLTLITVVMILSLLLGLRYWGILLALATSAYQFSSAYGLSLGVSVLLNSVPILYLLPRLYVKRRYQFTAVDLFLIAWLCGYFINFLRSYTIEGSLEFFLRTVFFCGCYYMLGRLLVMDRDKGTIYFREYICAIILLTLLFAGAAQDVSHQELAEQLQFD